MLLQNPDNSWIITDTKIALTDMTPETRRRYETQVSCYATLFATERGIDGPINCAIETFGPVTERYDIQPSPSDPQQRLDALRNGGE